MHTIFKIEKCFMTLKKFSMAKMGHEKFIYQGKKNRLLNFLCLRSFMFRRKKIITFQNIITGKPLGIGDI